MAALSMVAENEVISSPWAVSMNVPMVIIEAGEVDHAGRARRHRVGRHEMIDRVDAGQVNRHHAAVRRQEARACTGRERGEVFDRATAATSHAAGTDQRERAGALAVAGDTAGDAGAGGAYGARHEVDAGDSTHADEADRLCVAREGDLAPDGSGENSA